MSKKRQQAIEEIINLTLNFSNQVLNQLHKLQELIDSPGFDISDEQFSELRKREKEFDKLEIKVSDDIIKCIVLHQPVASDLRTLIACYRISINLERIGDLAMNIVKFILKIKDRNVIKILPGVINKMLSSSIVMVRKAILSFSNNDKELALWTLKMDDEIDEMNQNLLKKTISKSDFDKETRKIMEGFIQLSSIISNVERIGDHATNIAESSIYAIDGLDLRHTKLPG